MDDPIDQWLVDIELYIHRNYRNWSFIMQVSCYITCVRHSLHRDEGHENCITWARLLLADVATYRIKINF